MEDEAKIVDKILKFANDFSDEDEFFSCKKLSSAYESILGYNLIAFGLEPIYTGKGYLLRRLEL